MNDKDIFYIVNSQYLFDYFKTYFPSITNQGIYFKPAFPYSLYSNSFEEKREGKRKLFFYSRPLNPRNMFFKGIELLNEAINRGVINTSRWDIYLVGQDIPNIVFDNGYHPYIYGRLKWKQYGEFLKYIDIGMCLMISPHPSYVPYDVAASGAIAITNKAYNKIKIEESENIVTSDLSADSFVDNIKYAIELAEDENRRKRNYQNDSIPRNWKEAVGCVIDYMMEREKDV